MGNTDRLAVDVAEYAEIRLKKLVIIGIVGYIEIISPSPVISVEYFAQRISLRCIYNVCVYRMLQIQRRDSARYDVFYVIGERNCIVELSPSPATLCVPL